MSNDFEIHNTIISSSELANVAEIPMFNAEQLYGTDISSTLNTVTSGSVLYYDSGEWTSTPSSSLLGTYTHTQVTTTPYTVLLADDILGVRITTTSPSVITLPAISTLTGRKKRYTIVDEGGNAVNNNITVTANAADSILGQSTFVINQNYNSINIYSDPSTPSSGWFIA